MEIYNTEVKIVQCSFYIINSGLVMLHFNTDYVINMYSNEIKSFKCEVKFCSAKVTYLYIVLQVPEFKEWFNIKYENDETIYTYKLMDDLKNGDLTIDV